MGEEDLSASEVLSLPCVLKESLGEIEYVLVCMSWHDYTIKETLKIYQFEGFREGKITVDMTTKYLVLHVHTCTRSIYHLKGTFMDNSVY